MNTKGYSSPGVGYTETEILPQILGSNTLAIGIVGGASKGPTELTQINSVNQLYETFGYPKKGDYGLYAAEDVLLNSNRLYYKRVIDSDAVVATAGTATDVIHFETKTEDSTMNGFTVKVNVDVSKEVTVAIFDLKNSLVESLTGFSLDFRSPYFIEKIYNNNSKFLNIIVESELTNPQLDVNGDPVINYTGGTLTIENGNDGISKLKSEDIIGTGNSGIKAFYSTDNVDIFTLIVPGWFDSEVINELDKLTRYRGDIMVPLDPPQGLSPNKVIEWTNAEGTFSGEIKLDNPHFTVNYPWIVRKDRNSREDLILPPSGFIASQYAYSDKKSNPWVAPAGIPDNRGVIYQATGVEYELSKEERDLLYEGNNIVNPIVKFNSYGVVLFGIKTTLRTPNFEQESAYTKVNVRRLANYIRKFVLSISLTELFNPNDRFTWDSWKLKIEPRLRIIKEGRGIWDYKITMDESTVSEDDVTNGRMPGTIMVRPSKAVEWIPINFVVTSDKVMFEGDDK